MLAVAGGKGGCGKTTTTLGLALAAGRRGRSVLAVDADVDVPDLHRVAGIDTPGDRHAGEIDPLQSDVPRGRTPRPIEGAAGVSVLPTRPRTTPGSLPDRLRGTAHAYDLVILDCPAGGGRDAAVPLRVADRAVLVTTADEPSLGDAAKTAAMARALGTPVDGALLTRTGRVPEDVPALLGTTTVRAVPPARSPLQDDEVGHCYRQFVRRLPSV